MAKTQKQQVDENSLMLKVLERDINTIKDNHLAHMAEDIDRLESKVDKMDARLWWVLGLLVASTIVGMLGERLNGFL